MGLSNLSALIPTSGEVKSVCVFCGAGDGGDPIYTQQGYELGKLLAQNDIRVVYGGGSIGVMGSVAKGALENGGKVLGIVPEPLFKQGSKQISEVVIVPDMHSRKKRMADESDGFICLPGGFGTMEEMLEMITWSQLNIHAKPILLLNTKGFYNLFVDWIQVAVKEQFIREANANIFVSCNTKEKLLEVLKSYKAPETRYGLDWTKKDEEKRQSLV